MINYRKGNSNDLATLFVELVDKQIDMMTNIQEIKRVTQKTRMLSFNSSIETARAGAAGAGFNVIAKNIQTLADASKAANEHSEDQMNKPVEMINDIAGVRTADIAYDLIDKIDRNLFERNCDVQAWATFDLIIDSLNDPNKENQDAVNKLLKNSSACRRKEHMPQKFQKRKQKEGYDKDKEKEKPMIRDSKACEERIAGFVDLRTGEFTEVMRIHNDREMDEFLETYDISVAEITKE